MNLFIYIASSHPDRNSNYQFPSEGNVNPTGAAVRKNKTFRFFETVLADPLNPEIWARSRYVLTTVPVYRYPFNIYMYTARPPRPSVFEPP